MAETPGWWYETETPEWWYEVDEILHKNQEWSLYKILKRIDILENKLDRIIGMLNPETKPVTATINMEGTNMADITVPDTNPPLSAAVEFKDVHGHPTPPQDVPQWSSSDSTVATVDASSDPAGLAAVVTLLGPGATVISVSSTDTDGTVVGAAGTVTVTSGPPMTGEVTFS